MEGVAYRVSPVWLIFRALGFIGVSLVVFDCVRGWGVLLVVLDCGCGWEVSRRVLCRVALVVFDRGFHQTAEKKIPFYAIWRCIQP